MEDNKLNDYIKDNLEEPDIIEETPTMPASIAETELETQTVHSQAVQTKENKTEQFFSETKNTSAEEYNEIKPMRWEDTPLFSFIGRQNKNQTNLPKSENDIFSVTDNKNSSSSQKAPHSAAAFEESREIYDSAGTEMLFASIHPEEFVLNGFSCPRETSHKAESSPFDQTFKFVNMPLPYRYDALQPFIDKLTMQLHHQRHLQRYIDGLNAALAPYPRYHSWRLERLLQMANVLPPDLRVAVLNNGGGVYNHFFYFESLTPCAESKKIPPSVSSLLITSFKSVADFRAKFKKKALSVFGSGYAWLVLGTDGRAEIITTANQDTPLAKRQYPLLNIDVWEHAYYLKHYNLRDAYIDDWFNVLNWHKVATRLSEIRIRR